MQSRSSALFGAVAVVLLAACGKKEPAPEAPQEPKAAQTAVELICSYAPSQSAVVSHLASAAGGTAAAAAAVAKAAGLSAVAHSSGAYIFTGAGGYLAGTLGTAIAGPVLVGVGLAVGGSAATVEVLCVPRNHPDLVSKVEAAAQEFFARAKSSVSSASASAAPIVSGAKNILIKAGNDAFDYARRKSVEVTEALKK